MAEAVHLTPVQFDVAAGQLLQVRTQYVTCIFFLSYLGNAVTLTDPVPTHLSNKAQTTRGILRPKNSVVPSIFANL
jgi:hypothetical protein